MTGEQGLFLALLRDHIRGTKEAIPGPETDWDALLSLAEAQSLAGVCYVQMRELSGVPEDALERFHTAFLNEVYFYANRQAELSAVRNGMEALGLPVLAFKGTAIKDAWPVPELRTMGDIDLLIRPQDREAADALMLSLGYERYVDNPDVWTYFKQGIVFELHVRLFYEHLTSQVDYRAYFDRAWDGKAERLEAGYEFLYFIVHTAKHITNKGMGFRAFLDMIFWTREQTMDRSWVRDQLRELELLRFAETCSAFCRMWFGMGLPLEERELDGEFAEFVTDKMFRDGTFGLTNSQNEASGSAKEIAHADAPYTIGAMRLTVRRLFPPYEDMRIIPWYGFVDGRPWLLPAAWVYRWFYCMVNKSDSSFALLAEPFRKRDVVERRMDRIRDWGL